MTLLTRISNATTSSSPTSSIASADSPHYPYSTFNGSPVDSVMDVVNTSPAAVEPRDNSDEGGRPQASGNPAHGLSQGPRTNVPSTLSRHMAHHCSRRSTMTSSFSHRSVLDSTASPIDSASMVSEEGQMPSPCHTSEDASFLSHVQFFNDHQNDESLQTVKKLLQQLTYLGYHRKPVPKAVPPSVSLRIDKSSFVQSADIINT